MEAASTSKNISPEQLITERGTTHGDFGANAKVSQQLKYALKNSAGWNNLPSVHKEALEMICLKMSRAVTGDHDVRDHYDDIAGYAKLISKTCTK